MFEFVEKPSLGEIREHFQVHDEREFDNLPLLTNAGFYLVDASALRGIAEHPQIAELRRRRLDFGKDLLPWMVGHGYPVYAHPVRRIGDLGNVRDYIDTMVDALHGNFAVAGAADGAAVRPRAPRVDRARVAAACATTRRA